MGRMQLSTVLMVVSCVYAVKCLAISNAELEDFEDYIKRTSQLSPILKKGVEADEHDEIDEVSEHAWEQSGKFEGDLILNDRQRRLIVENVAEGLSRNGLRDGTKRWPNGEVVFYIQVEHFNQDQIQAIMQGMEDLAQASCIKFRKYKKGDRDAVVIQGNRPGCFSQVGYQGGYQVLNLSGRHPVGRGCFRHGTVVHEMLHTLGFYHMQSSPERDDYVAIQWSNIVQRARNNFRKYNSFSVSNFGIGYDYDSVMHYSRRAFSVNGQDTIVPKKTGADIGQRVGLSEKDTQKLNRMYCDADSDPLPADEDNTSKKKSVKNKPLDIYGLGYHQGNAVIIKVLPQAQQRKFPEMHTSYVFDYFSKTPHLLSSTEKEDNWSSQDVIELYKPKNRETYKVPVNVTGHAKYYNEGATEPEKQGDHFTKEKYVTNTNIEIPTKIETTHVEAEQDLIEPFDRLFKIIKSHVYPSQNPDLSVYRINKENNEYDIFSQKLEKENVPLDVPDDPIKHQITQAEKTKSAVQLINNLFDLNNQQSLQNKENHYHPISMGYDKKDSKNSNKKHEVMIVSELPNKNAKDSRYIDPSYTAPYIELESDYHPSSHYKAGTEEDAFKKYNSKLNHMAKTDDSYDDWHQKYAPNKYNSAKYHSESYRNHIHGIENNDDDYYSSSNPIRIGEYIFSPFQTEKHNDVNSQEERR